MDRAYVDELIRRIVARHPARQAGSAAELDAQRMLEAEMQGAGLATERRPFRYSTNLYAVFTLHGAVGAIGCALLAAGQLLPLAFALHLIAGVSLAADVTRSAHLLRRLLPYRDSVNVLGVLPASGEPRRRVVVLGHIDGAFSGLLFHPAVIKATTSAPMPFPLSLLHKTMRLPIAALLALAGIDALCWLAPELSGVATTVTAGVLSFPVAMLMLLNGEIALARRHVPGANDNLTACAALPVLARRLAADKPDDVELVFVSSGAEEAGTGGAFALAKSGTWDKERTVVLALDSLTNGTLRIFEEGELWRIPPSAWLRALVEEVRASEPRFADQGEPFDIPAGASDALPFLHRGYEAFSLGCVDSTIGAPRHYHRLSDTPDNLDIDQLMLSIDFAEAALRRVMIR